MKVWRHHSDYLLSGEWHVHTSHTDGKSDVFEYCQRATELKIPLIAFTEHVRRHLTYDFSEFLSKIDAARELFDLVILSGCETKVLPGGELDVERDILKEVDYPVFAFHSFPLDKALYVHSLIEAIRNKYVCAWAHPGLFLKKYLLNLTDDELGTIMDTLAEHEILLEINSKYQLPPKHWLDIARAHNVTLVRGSDVHGIDDLQAIHLISSNASAQSELH